MARASTNDPRVWLAQPEVYPALALRVNEDWHTSSFSRKTIFRLFWGNKIPVARARAAGIIFLSF
jgi:hypothetical protein